MYGRVFAAAFLPLLVSATPQAKSPEISVYEDSYGVPSIFADNVNDASYALGYVEAKDHAKRMALNYKLARGRLAEVEGKSSLLQDGFLRAIGFERRAIAWSSSPTAKSRSMLDAFVAGANRGLEEQKGTLPAWVEPFTVVDVVAYMQFVNAAFPLLDLSSKLSIGAGSNQFALAPSRTTTRHPILSIDPHLGLDGQDGGIVWEEFAMYTPDAHFRGVAIPGLPLGVLGHNDRVAWSMTNNNPSLYTIYTVKANPDNQAQYSYHGQWREFKFAKEEMHYLERGELKSTTQTFRLTDWGPMIPFSNRAVRFSLPEIDATFQQGLQMLRAQSADQFRHALRLRGLSMWNYVYADVAGNIGYQYNADVAKRSDAFNWGKPVPGEDPKSEWGPLWNLDDLPHIENPASGILINCNSNPSLTPLDDELKGPWPSYVTSYGPTTRFEILARILRPDGRRSPEDAQRVATDCTVPYAREAVAQLARFATTGEAIDVLKRWDCSGKIDSVGCALFTYWLRDRRENDGLVSAAGRGETWTPDQGAAAKASLDSAARKMLAEQGALSKKWGAIQTIGRGSKSLPVQGFGYVASGSGLAAVSPASAETDTVKEGKSHITFGSSFRMIVSLDPRGIKSWSVLPYGNSDIPASPHFSDQMALYAVGKYKFTNYGPARAKKNALKIYRLHR